MGSTPTGLSASRGAAILGMSKWSTPFEIWQKIQEERQPGFNQSHGYMLPEFEYSSVMKWGHAFENAVIKLAEKVQKTKIIDRERAFAYIVKNMITCHIDGAYRGTGKLHEGKTTSAYIFNNSWGEPGSNRVPRDYNIQTQHQMLCTGAQKNIISVLVFPCMVMDWEEDGYEVRQRKNKWYIYHDQSNWSEPPMEWAQPLSEMGYFHQYHIHRNQELIDLMVEKYAAFWHDHILTDIPPEPQNYDDIKRLCPEPKGTIVASDQVERWCYEYKEIGEELGAKGTLKKRREQLKVMILNWMRVQDSCVDDDSRERTVLRNSRGHKLIGFNGKMLR